MIQANSYMPIDDIYNRYVNVKKQIDKKYTVQEEVFKEAYYIGFAAGQNEGYAEGWQDGADETKERLKNISLINKRRKKSK